ncbi:hypothetical protein GALMADRAFT_240154 [Galerina marginata CBS 339.88]|uniref:Rad1-domain-containing protein n=1 Tax=Galerina marginata (strain CBS 339.88) TaxID=685588 RepID=A0A067TSF1_GALM3|nr:hypothetical protein GALMADRAFT_240154 [Galerina marginata CBS 339.88]
MRITDCFSTFFDILQVLTASVHDVRYFAALLRGVQFVNRATVTVTETGLTITVEEARTLLGTAFIFSDVFDEYTFHAEPPPRSLTQRSQPRPKRRKKAKPKPPSGQDSETESSSEEDTNDAEYRDDANEDKDAERDEHEYPENAAFEIPLGTLIECLNIFGTAGSASGNVSSGSGGGGGSGDGGGGGRGRGRGSGRGGGGGGGWRAANNNGSDAEDGGGGGRDGSRGLDAYFGSGGTEKRTSMRLSYPGAGYPLTLIIAEDASGPTTTCEITTFDPEPHLELDFDNSKTVLKIILKSSWLRDALSELDPSCEKLTFIGNPPASATQRQPDASMNASTSARQKGKQTQGAVAKPMLRIQATGTFGSTEMDYPNDRDVLETFECTRNVTFSYRFGHIARALKALSSSTKTSLRIDDDGLLSLQFLMPSPKPRTAGGRTEAFIEFRCLALDDEF